jgi:subtilisin family serine protease
MAVTVAVIDGPYDGLSLSTVLARAPINLGGGKCSIERNSACNHGTFIMGLLGARWDAAIPGLCAGCQILHVPLFPDEPHPAAKVSELARAIRIAVAAGANLINLSLAILGDEVELDPELAVALARLIHRSCLNERRM